MKDKAEEIDTILWNTQGKVRAVLREEGSDKPDLHFRYGPGGHRTLKIAYYGQVRKEVTWYVRDADGQTMATYTHDIHNPSSDIVDYTVTDITQWLDDNESCFGYEELIASWPPVDISDFANCLAMNILPDYEGSAAELLYKGDWDDYTNLYPELVDEAILRMNYKVLTQALVVEERSWLMDELTYDYELIFQALLDYDYRVFMYHLVDFDEDFIRDYYATYLGGDPNDPIDQMVEEIKEAHDPETIAMNLVNLGLQDDFDNFQSHFSNAEMQSALKNSYPESDFRDMLLTANTDVAAQAVDDHGDEQALIDGMIDYDIEKPLEWWSDEGPSLINHMADINCHLMTNTLHECFGTSPQDYADAIEDYWPNDDTHDQIMEDISDFEDEDDLNNWTKSFSLDQQMIYGSDRLGLVNRDLTLSEMSIDSMDGRFKAPEIRDQARDVAYQKGWETFRDFIVAAGYDSTAYTDVLSDLIVSQGKADLILKHYQASDLLNQDSTLTDTLIQHISAESLYKVLADDNDVRLYELLWKKAHEPLAKAYFESDSIGGRKYLLYYMLQELPYDVLKTLGGYIYQSPTHKFDMVRDIYNTHTPQSFSNDLDQYATLAEKMRMSLQGPGLLRISTLDSFGVGLFRDLLMTYENNTWIANVLSQYNIEDLKMTLLQTHAAPGTLIDAAIAVDPSAFLSLAMEELPLLYGEAISAHGTSDETFRQALDDYFEDWIGSSVVADFTYDQFTDSTYHIADPYYHTRTLGDKRYELDNHLGNVLTVVSDRKIAVEDQGNPGTVEYYEADVVSAQDYYPFGMIMPGRSVSAGEYRYGFNAQEMDNEWASTGSHIAFEYRIHDTRLGRFLSPDPLIVQEKRFPFYSPYQFAGNKPIVAIDLEGLQEYIVHEESGGLGGLPSKMEIRVVRDGDGNIKNHELEKPDGERKTYDDVLVLGDGEATGLGGLTYIQEMVLAYTEKNLIDGSGSYSGHNLEGRHFNEDDNEWALHNAEINYEKTGTLTMVDPETGETMNEAPIMDMAKGNESFDSEKSQNVFDVGAEALDDNEIIALPSNLEGNDLNRVKEEFKSRGVDSERIIQGDHEDTVERYEVQIKDKK